MATLAASHISNVVLPAVLNTLGGSIAVLVSFAALLFILIFFRLRAPRRPRIRRDDSLEILSTASIRARTPQVTHLDFPAPAPPFELKTGKPLVLRTFSEIVNPVRIKPEYDVHVVVLLSASDIQAQTRRRCACTTAPISSLL